MAKALTGSFTARNKVCGGTTAATVASTDLPGVIDGDGVELLGQRAAVRLEDVGNEKGMNGESSLAGDDAGSYSVDSSHTAQARITAKALTGSFTATNKVYDGTARQRWRAPTCPAWSTGTAWSCWSASRSSIGAGQADRWAATAGLYPQFVAAIQQVLQTGRNHSVSVTTDRQPFSRARSDRNLCANPLWQNVTRRSLS